MIDKGSYRRFYFRFENTRILENDLRYILYIHLETNQDENCFECTRATTCKCIMRLVHPCITETYQYNFTPLNAIFI